MVSEWLFHDEPEVPTDIRTVPVIFPEQVALRVKFIERDARHRVFGEHQVVPEELEHWRSIAEARRFPWEIEACDGDRHRDERSDQPPADTPIHCLAILARTLPNGEIDAEELEQFLEETAGDNCWLMMSVWAFALAPEVESCGSKVVPVICPEETAIWMRLADQLSEDSPRIVGEHAVGEVELRGWRYIAATVLPNDDGKGLFPWKIETCGRDLQHG